MSLYDNVVPIQGAEDAKRVRSQLEKSDYVNRKLQDLFEESSSLDLDDATNRSIVKYQTRLLMTTMFEKVHVALGALTQEVIKNASVKELTGLIVGMTGRLDTLMNVLERLSKQDGSDMDQYVTRLRSMSRAEALKSLRIEFEQVFGAIFTDEEREQLFQDLDEQVLLDRLGTSDSADNVRSASDGETTGSSRWVRQIGPLGVLPPPSGSS